MAEEVEYANWRMWAHQCFYTEYGQLSAQRIDNGKKRKRLSGYLMTLCILVHVPTCGSSTVLHRAFSWFHKTSLIQNSLVLAIT